MINQKFIEINIDQKGVRLDKFLAKHFSDLSYSAIQKKIRLGKFKVNGKKEIPSYKILIGDKIYFGDEIYGKIGIKKKTFISDNLKSLVRKSIIYEDNFIIALNKPYGIPVQGGSKIKFSIDDVLTFLSSDKRPYRLTHRIDKNTSGVLVIAKSKEVASNITKLFREEKIKKIYWTIVKGVPKNVQGIINNPISKVSQNGIDKIQVTKNYEKKAITIYKVLETNKNLSLLEVEPRTGRKHQIRVHLQSRNCPILGDEKYNLSKEKKTKKLNFKMHLHAKKISFKLYQKAYSLEAQIPNYFLDTLKENNFTKYLSNNVHDIKKK